MTRDDAITITGMILNNWVKPDWTEGQVEAFVNSLVTFDAELAVEAVALAHKELRFRPPFSEFLGFYRAAKAKAEAAHHKPRTAGGTRNSLPLWVKRWVCARFLYAKFGRDQDLRVFPEQRDWTNAEDPLMPVDEWVTEADHITEREAHAAVKNCAVTR